MAANRKIEQRKAPSFIQSHAHELIGRHGARTIGMIAHSFANLGNPIPGNTPDEQWAVIEKELIADPRMVKVSENPGRGLDWYGLKSDEPEEEAQIDSVAPQPAPLAPIPALAEEIPPPIEEPASEAPEAEENEKDPTNGRRK